MDSSRLNDYWMLLQQILHILLWLSETIESTRIFHESIRIQHESTRNILGSAQFYFTENSSLSCESSRLEIFWSRFESVLALYATIYYARVNSKHARVDLNFFIQPFLFNFQSNLIFLDFKASQVFLNDFKAYHKDLLPTKIFLTKLQRYCLLFYFNVM